MRTFLVFLRGHFGFLAQEELFASFDAEGIDYDIVEKHLQYVLFLSSSDPIPAVQRCALTHFLIEVHHTFSFSGKDYTPTCVSSLPFSPHDSFRVRIVRHEDRATPYSRADLERVIGGFILSSYSELSLTVNLQSPSVPLLGLLHLHMLYLGKELWSLDLQEYHNREPSARPFFRPGSMKSDFGRALVNLSRLSSGQLLYDPFCGSGGLLIESSLLGAYSLGSDLDDTSLAGAQKNLSALSKDCSFSLFSADSRFLPIRSVDAIVTDPPYSIQSSTHGELLPNLLFLFLTEAKRILRRGAFIVFCSPTTFEPEKIAERANFTVKSIIDVRIHRSLTRRIVVGVNK